MPDLGEPKVEPKAQLRVLSLLSASTEIVCRLGCAHLLVGRSHGCDDPPMATALPVATAPRVDPNIGSREIDEAVRVQAAAGGPIYHIHSALVQDLKPDVIITQEQCRICAVTPEDVASACATLPDATLVTIKPTTLDDVLGDCVTIARAMGVPERGEQLVRYMRNRLAALSAMVPRPGDQPIRVVHVEWLAPLMGSGYWIAECMEAAGCTMVHGTRGGHSQTLDSASLLSNADVLIISPCGFGIERTHAELKSLDLLESAEFRALPAVRRGAVAVADGNLYFNRSSCGVLETAEIVAEVVHEGMCGLFGHHGRRWVRLCELEAFCTRVDAASPNKPCKVAAPVANEQEAAGDLERQAKARKTMASQPERVLRTPSQHVTTQLAAMQANDFAAAFALNSDANCARLGGAAKFAQVVANNTSFRVLADSKTTFEVNADGDAKGAADSSAVSVRVVAQPVGAEAVRFVFDLRRDEDGAWATDGVRIEC